MKAFALTIYAICFIILAAFFASCFAQVNLVNFVVQKECPDGQMPGMCPGQPLTDMSLYSTIRTRYRDWGIGTTGWMTKDAFRWFSVDGHEFFANIWSWDASFPTNYSRLTSNPCNGGEVIEVYRNADGVMEARFLGTRDCGTPNRNQFFNPCEDKNHGWVIADEQVPTGKWSGRNYGQRATLDAPGCPEPLNHGWTETRLETLNIPFQWPNGWVFYFNVRTIISQQYNNDSVEHANRAEGFACLENYGCRIWWKCLKDYGEDLDYRDPKIKFIGCREGWKLADMRATLRPYGDQDFTPAFYGWPW